MTQSQLTPSGPKNSDQHSDSGGDDRIPFARPALTVYGNLLATLLFAIAGMLYMLAGRTWFGVGWWIIGALWLRRYFWARSTPLLEIGRKNLLVNIGPYRVRPMPLAEIDRVELDDGRVVLELNDGSKAKFSGFDLNKDAMPRFVTLLQERLLARQALSASSESSSSAESPD